MNRFPPDLDDQQAEHERAERDRARAERDLDEESCEGCDQPSGSGRHRVGCPDAVEGDVEVTYTQEEAERGDAGVFFP